MAAATNFDINKHCTEHVSSKPLHSNNIDTKSCAARYTSPQSGVMTPSRARARFSERVSNGISVLIKRHGYSRERASDLILKEISHGGVPPSEDEVFSVMGDLGVGMDDAVKALTVAQALRRVEQDRGLSSSDAIEHLSSCLTVMKILGKVESQQAEAHLNYNDSVSVLKDQQPEKRGSVHNSSVQNSTFKTSLLKCTKSNLPRQSLPAASLRKRSSMDPNDTHSTCKNTRDDAVNEKVAKQTIADMEQSHQNTDSPLSRSKTSLPRTKRASDASGNRLDDGQPPSSRPRLGSIGIS